MNYEEVAVEYAKKLLVSGKSFLDTCSLVKKQFPKLGSKINVIMENSVDRYRRSAYDKN